MAGAHRDDGFTLAELLVVIVILGILSTVTVFAVRGITDGGQIAACDTELRDLATSEEAHYALVGSYGDEAALVTNGALRSESERYDVTLDAGGIWSAVPAPNSRCTESATGGAAPSTIPIAAGPDRSTYTITLASLQTAPGNANNFNGHDSIEYNIGGGANEILIFGRTEGELDFVDMVNAVPATSRRIAFVNLDEFASNEEIRNAMNTSRNTGFTTFALYPDDDPGDLAQTYVNSQIGVGSSSGNEEFVLLDVFGGPNQTLLELLAFIG